MMSCDSPPAAVAMRAPSGETWQLYTSKSFCSPVEDAQDAHILAENAINHVDGAILLDHGIFKPKRWDDAHRYV